MIRSKILFFTALLSLASCAKDAEVLNELIAFETKTQLLFPERNSECTEGTILSEIESQVSFRWTSVQNAIKYELFLTNLTNNLTESFETTNPTIAIILLRGTPYSWRVSTIFSENEPKVDSNIESFYNASASGEFAFVPFPSVCIAPENNVVISLETNSIILEWEASDLDGDIINYDVYFGTNPSPLLYAEEVADTQLEVSEIVAGNTYYWQIVTRDAQGNESNSEVFTFEVTN